MALTYLLCSMLMPILRSTVYALSLEHKGFLSQHFY